MRTELGSQLLKHSNCVASCNNHNLSNVYFLKSVMPNLFIPHPVLLMLSLNQGTLNGDGHDDECMDISQSGYY